MPEVMGRLPQVGLIQFLALLRPQAVAAEVQVLLLVQMVGLAEVVEPYLSNQGVQVIHHQQALLKVITAAQVGRVRLMVAEVAVAHLLLVLQQLLFQTTEVMGAQVQHLHIQDLL